MGAAQSLDVDKVLKESMHDDSKETFGGNVPSERDYVIAAIAWNIQFPGGNDGGACGSAQRRNWLGPVQNVARRSLPGCSWCCVSAIGSSTKFARRRARELRCSRVPKASLANLQGKARVQRELIHSLVRSNLMFGPDPDVLNRSSRLAAGHMDRGFDRERDNGAKEFRRGVGLPKLGQSKCVTESLR